MTDDKASELIKAAAELAKAVPVYPDLVQPAAKQIGKSLELIGRTVNVVLAPLQAVVWGFEQFNEFLSTTVAEKLVNTPEDKIGTPKANVAGPLLESLRYAGTESELRELYANLLAEAIDRRTSDGVLPSFVEILKQLSSDEAKLIRFFAKASGALPVIHISVEHYQDNKRTGVNHISRNISFLGVDAKCEHVANSPSYIDNLARLGLVEIFPDATYYVAEGVYDRLEQDSNVISLIVKSSIEGKSKGKIIRSGLRLTMMGRAFVTACVVPHESKKLS